jgi:aminoglycoside 3-N-acetyltransferase
VKRRPIISEDFKTQLVKLGLNQGDVILMHSSMKALKTKKTPADFIEDILSIIGSEGTLLIPALSYRDVNAENPYFSAKETEPCIGLIPKTFFHMPGVIRSLHPTHSVCAFGKMAGELTSKHILDETPVGPHSPITRIVDYNGKILFIGDVLKCCTFMHGIEELVGASYCLVKERTHYVIKDEKGNTVEKDMFAHDFVGWEQEYQRIKDILDYPEIKTGKVGQAECYLIDSAALFTKAKEKLCENQYYFVTDVGG